MDATPTELATRLHQMRLHAALKTQASYRAALRAGVRGLWSGVLDMLAFHDAFDAAINRYFTEAWVEGMMEAGLAAEDMTREEQAALFELIFTETTFIAGFAASIVAESKDAGFPLEPHLARVETWVKRYSGIKSQALTMASTDPVEEWVTHAKESCISCLKLNGQRRRASSWAKSGLRPQSMQLQCMRSAGGVPVCQCELRVTDQPPTRGRLPKV